MTEKKISRNEFIRKISLGLAGFTIFTSESCQQVSGNKNNNVRNNHPGNSSNCQTKTKSATEGPFFVNNVPESININNRNFPGTKMRINGIVYGKDKKPLENAKVEIWHADSEGVYHPENNGAYSRYPEEKVALRGLTFTNKKGEFAFNSIRPGLYTGRRRHIHWRISEENNGEVITQTYWLSEKGNARESEDLTDQNTDICRYINFSIDNQGGINGKVEFYIG